MPSTTTRRLAALSAVGVLAYSVLVTAEVLLGTVAAALLGILVLFGDAVVRDTDRRRRRAAVVTAAGVFLGVVVLGYPLVGLVAGSGLVLVYWLVAPRGPPARLVRWARGAREDLRVVRESVADGSTADD